MEVLVEWKVWTRDMQKRKQCNPFGIKPGLVKKEDLVERGGSRAGPAWDILEKLHVATEGGSPVETQGDASGTPTQIQEWAVETHGQNSGEQTRVWIVQVQWEGEANTRQSILQAATTALATVAAACGEVYVRDDGHLEAGSTEIAWEKYVRLEFE